MEKIFWGRLSTRRCSAVAKAVHLATCNPNYVPDHIHFWILGEQNKLSSQNKNTNSSLICLACLLSLFRGVIPENQIRISSLNLSIPHQHLTSSIHNPRLPGELRRTERSAVPGPRRGMADAPIDPTITDHWGATRTCHPSTYPGRTRRRTWPGPWFKSMVIGGDRWR